MATNTILITGATGTQGFGTIKALASYASASSPITVHAPVRDPSSSKANSLSALATAHLTIKLSQATFDDVPALTAAAKSCNAAFINVSPSLDPADLDAEPRHFANILSALSDTPTIKRVVYPTVNGVGDPSVPGNFKNIDKGTFLYSYLASKSGNQESLRKLSEEKGWSFTFLQPAYFLTNFLAPISKFMFAQLAERKIVTAFPQEFKLSYLDPGDIGRFAAALFVADENDLKSKWDGMEIPLASVNTPEKEVVSVINKLLGLKDTAKGEIKVVYEDEAEAREKAKMNPLLAAQFYQIDNPKPVDVERVRSYGVELGGVEAFFEANREALEEAVGL